MSLILSFANAQSISFEPKKALFDLETSHFGFGQPMLPYMVGTAVNFIGYSGSKNVEFTAVANMAYTRKEVSMMAKQNLRFHHRH
jgi:hypothetical protein